LIPAFLRRQRNQRRLLLKMLSAKAGMSPKHFKSATTLIALVPGYRERSTTDGIKTTSATIFYSRILHSS